MAELEDLDLPAAPAPLGRYERGMIHGGIGFLSGQFPLIGGKLLCEGRVGLEVSPVQAGEAARMAAINALAQIKAITRSERVRFLTLLRLDGYVASADQFFSQAQVLDGASELFLTYLGEAGRHARTAFSVPRLPLNAPLELAVTFAVSTKRPGGN